MPFGVYTDVRGVHEVPVEGRDEPALVGSCLDEAEGLPELVLGQGQDVRIMRKTPTVMVPIASKAKNWSHI